MKSLYQLLSKSTLVALCVVSFAMFSCEGDEGPIGPQGEPGEQGAPGPEGPKGEDAFFKAGFAEGTIEGTRQDGTPFTEDFRYERIIGPALSIEDGALAIVRFEGDVLSALHGQRARLFSLELWLDNDESGDLIATAGDFRLNFTKELEDLALFEFYANYSNEGSSTLKITNFEHNPTTGIVTFDFEYKDIEGGGDTSTGHEVSIVGKFNSGMKVYKNVLMRE